MTTLNPIGALDQITADLITALRTDSELNKYPFLQSERLINFGLEDDNLDPATEFPVHTLQSGRSEESPPEHSGGFFTNRLVPFTIRTWFSPTDRDENMPSVPNFTERVDTALRNADNNNTFPAYITGYEWLASYPGQFGVSVQTGFKKLAYTANTECVIYYDTL